MSRCRACNAKMYDNDSPHVNPLTGDEDDLCIYCRGESKYAYIEHEYLGGPNPRSGVTAPTPTDN